MKHMATIYFFDEFLISILYLRNITSLIGIRNFFKDYFNIMPYMDVSVTPYVKRTEVALEQILIKTKEYVTLFWKVQYCYNTKK